MEHDPIGKRLPWCLVDNAKDKNYIKFSYEYKLRLRETYLQLILNKIIVYKANIYEYMFKGIIKILKILGLIFRTRPTNQIIIVEKNRKIEMVVEIYLKKKLENIAGS